MQDLSPVIIFRFAIRVNFRVEYSCDPRNKGRGSNCSSKLNTRPMINSSRREREKERDKGRRAKKWNRLLTHFSIVIGTSRKPFRLSRTFAVTVLLSTFPAKERRVERKRGANSSSDSFFSSLIPLNWLIWQSPLKKKERKKRRNNECGGEREENGRERIYEVSGRGSNFFKRWPDTRILSVFLSTLTEPVQTAESKKLTFLFNTREN